MKESSNDVLREWYKLRHQTMLLSILQMSIYVFELASVAISALYYYKYMIKNENPTFYYSLAMGTVYFTAFLSSIYACNYVDQTGKLREFVLVTIVISMLGNFLYLISYSKWFPVLGRALCGIADSARPGFAGKKCPFY